MAIIPTLLSLTTKPSIEYIEGLLINDRNNFATMTREERISLICCINEMILLVEKKAVEWIQSLLLYQGPKMTDEERVYVTRGIIKQGDPRWTAIFLAEFGLNLPTEEVMNAVREIIKQGDPGWTCSFLIKFGSILPEEEFINEAGTILEHRAIKKRDRDDLLYILFLRKLDPNCFHLFNESSRKK